MVQTSHDQNHAAHLISHQCHYPEIIYILYLMIDKIISIILGLILGTLIYNCFLMKTSIVLNYNFKTDDKLKINNKCFSSH